MLFVHLHNHSNYSLLDGLSRLDEMVAKAKKLGMPALALTDHGNLYGAIEFYKACEKAGIKPIIGVEAYVAMRTRFDKEPNIDSRRYHLTLLAKNKVGYQNLLRMVSASYLEGFYYKPRMDKDLLRAHSEGIICLSGCMESELGRTLWARDLDKSKAVIKEHQEIFGVKNYYLEIMHHPKIERQMEIKEATIKLARELNIPLVATQDAHYLEPEDAKAHDTLVAIQTQATDENKRFSNQMEDFSFIAPEQAMEYFKDTPEAIENTVKIAERCELKLELGSWVFPNYPKVDGLNYEQMLHVTANDKLKKYLEKYPEKKDEATKRLEHELDVITTKGYSPYFLVVSDLINHAHSVGIFTNTRGSAAGSFTSFLLGITGVDPLVYELPFERFLTKDRPSPPDIDMDFADKRRDEIIDYARKMYGENHVAQIGTFGSMMARGAVRDVARALGHPYSVGDRLSNWIPLGSQGFPMTIDKAIELTPELKDSYEKEADTKLILDLAKRIEGGARHISVHAAGVVISPTPLTDYAPIQLDPKGGKIITQYDMYSIEEAGLLKFDFLGIRNLSILEDTVRLVQKILNIKVDINEIPLDDAKTFEMLARGETMGLFQLNGAGMTRWLKELKPSRIHDINAMVALYRPGPMESIPDYIERKHNPDKIHYLDKRLKTILDQSYGVITYQDDVMLISIHLAGYSWVEADKLRKAMSKKIPKEMEEQKEKLLKGFVANGLTEKKAQDLWHLIEPFAAYGFNKAHAASYGKVAYQTAYMKANYPTEYMTAVLTAESGDVEEIARIIEECKRMKIPVLPPDVNESFGDFTVVKGVRTPNVKDAQHSVSGDSIRFGLFTIKNLGTEIAEAVVSERKRGGPFISFADFLDRVKHKNLNKKSLESLIKAGAMDGLNEERGKLLANIDEALAYNREAGAANSNQDSLFGLMSDKSTIPILKLKDAPAATPTERLAWEKELLGLYLSGHPLDRFRKKFEKTENTITKAKTLKDGTGVVVAGLVEEAKVINTKKGDRMAFVRLADFTDKIECVIFSRVFVEHRDLILPEKCLAIRGKISYRNNEPSIIVESLKELN